MSNPPDVRQGPKSESVQALKEVAAALLRQACQLLEQIIHGQDDGQGWGHQGCRYRTLCQEERIDLDMCTSTGSSRTRAPSSQAPR